MIRFFPIIGLVLAGVIALAYIEPTYSNKIIPTQAAIASSDQALAAAASFKAKENELAAAKNAILPEDLARLEKLLPSSVDNVAIILDLNALAARSGMVLSDIGVTPPAEDQAALQGSIGSVDLTLTATGTYKAFRTFLSGIERSARMLDVIRVSVRGSDTGVYAYSMTIRLYWLR